MKDWRCHCGHEVLASEKPLPIKWTDGHTCFFREVKGDTDHGNTNRDDGQSQSKV